MSQENRKCENCGRKMRQAAYIPFNGGIIVCLPCCAEWENLGKPQTVAQYHAAINGKKVYQSDLITKK
jgi:hypothetical protein